MGPLLIFDTSRLDEKKVKEKTVHITKLDVALNNAIVRARCLGMYVTCAFVSTFCPPDFGP